LPPPGFSLRGENPRVTHGMWAKLHREDAVKEDAVTFSLSATDGAARAGVLRTGHGDVPTPAFMPVGTKATVKGLDPLRLRELGATILLGNTYHLHFRPGADLIEDLGGLHSFMAWDGPILTDSGGFQVFSLRDTISAIDEDGVTFRSVYDGDAARFTPELVAGVQRRLGSDIAMCLDVCPPVDVSREELEVATATTTRWAECQLAQPRAEGQLLFAVAQGGTDPELRRRSIEELAALDFDGFALGGLSVGEDRDLMLDTVAWSAPLLPTDKPRYFMGIGDPVGILEVVERGIDMFDCVLPTRLGRTGSALTWEGRLNMRNARFKRDSGPLDEACPCRACTGFSRAYLRHLVQQQELLGLILLSEHNVRFLLDLTAGARAAIERNELAAFKAAALHRLEQAAAAPGQEVSRG
jgi:queuine tRNA-ribosyltransferase